MGIEARPPAPVAPSNEDSPEHSFSTSLRRAVDTLFTYQPIATTLHETPHDEETQQFATLWQQGIAIHLEQTAKAAIAAYLDVFTQFKAGQTIATRGEIPGIDPYTIAEAAYGARIDQLQKSGELRKPSEISDPYTAEDHFDELRQLYKETCLDMGLAWPPPAKDAEDSLE